MNTKQKRFSFYYCMLFSINFMGGMKKEEDFHFPSTILKGFPSADKAAGNWGLSSRAYSKKYLLDHIREAIDKKSPDIVKKILSHAGCSLFSLKSSIKISYDSCAECVPLMRLFQHNISGVHPFDEWQEKLNILLRYGFHIPYNEYDLRDYDEWGIEIAESIAADPRLFGAFYYALERAQKSNIKTLFILKRRALPLLHTMPKDIINLLVKECTGYEELLENHLNCLIKFHQRPCTSVLKDLNKAVQKTGRVKRWAYDITRDQVKEKIGPLVLKNYERLFKEWREYHIE